MIRLLRRTADSLKISTKVKVRPSADRASSSEEPDRARQSVPRIVEIARGQRTWLPVEPMRSLRPGVSISFLFSLARKAAKMLATHAAKSAKHGEVELLDRREAHAANHRDQAEPLVALEIVLP